MMRLSKTCSGKHQSKRGGKGVELLIRLGETNTLSPEGTRGTGLGVWKKSDEGQKSSGERKGERVQGGEGGKFLTGQDLRFVETIEHPMIGGLRS